MIILTEIPDNLDDSSPINVGIWTAAHCSNISVETLLNSIKPSTIVLLNLLEMCRYIIRNAGPIRVSKLDGHMTRQMREQAYRDDVRNNPSKFTFAPSAFEEYHPVHIAEMMVIILNMLDEQGIDARVPTNSV